MIPVSINYLAVAKADCKSIRDWSGVIFDDKYYPIRLRMVCDKGRLVNLTVLKVST